MQHYVIEMKPVQDENGVTKSWFWGYYLDTQNRAENKNGPNSIGIYWCPKKKGAKNGFDELKAHLIACHEERINLLQKSLNELRKIEFKEK